MKDKLLQPPTPTKEELELLEQEVEENLKTKILIQDDFSIKDPYEGLTFFKKLKQTFFSERNSSLAKHYRNRSTWEPKGFFYSEYHAVKLQELRKGTKVSGS